jgi:dihydroorotate dehydrogenase (NAD+) catalytic subunit
MRMVNECSKAVKIPIIGCGGIMAVEDVVEYMLAGATAVEIGFLSFRNPTGMIAIINGLEQWCTKKGITRVAELTGAMRAHPPRDTYEAGMIGIS